MGSDMNGIVIDADSCSDCDCLGQSGLKGSDKEEAVI